MLGLYIGRFQPFHNAHLGIALQALRHCDQLLFILGSAQESRTRKNPFTAQERAEIIRGSLEGVGIAPERLVFAGIEDHPDDAVWCEWVQNAVAQYSPKPTLFGAEKDDSAYYLRIFPQWELRIFPVQILMSATKVRQKFFAGEAFEHYLQAAGSSFLHRFAQTPDFERLKQKWTDLAMLSYGLLQPEQFGQFLAWRANGDAYTLEVLQKELRLFKSGKIQIFVALEDQTIIATVQLVFSRSDLKPDFADGKQSAYVQALEVKPAYRRKGVGQGLMLHLEAVARASGFKRLTLMVELDNQGAIGLYQALGYNEFKRAFWTWKGVDYPTICLEKRL